MDIRCTNDLMKALDKLLEDSETNWDDVYEQRPAFMSFLNDCPDEYLAEYWAEVKPEKVLELGCGEGRNAAWLADRGCKVTAVDRSPEAIKNARRKAAEKNREIAYICGNVFEQELPAGGYDFVYDSGLFHHLAPHRRMHYIKLLAGWLRPEGALGLVCFAPGFEGQGGARERSDLDVYRERSLLGGTAYSKDKLVHLLSARFELIRIQPMHDDQAADGVFGKPFLWSSLWRKKSGRN